MMMRSKRLIGAVLALVGTVGVAGSVPIGAAIPVTPVMALARELATGPVLAASASGTGSVPVSLRYPPHAPAAAASLELVASDLEPTWLPLTTSAAAPTIHTVRRAGSPRANAALRPTQADPAPAARATQLTLRGAARDRLATRVALERSATGADSFHTNTPPPPALV